MHEHIVKEKKEKQDFLTSCFFYYQNSIYNSSSSSSKTIPLSNAFKKIKTTPLIIIDYPNIIHILQEKFHTQKEVAKHFYQYLLKNNNKKLIVILCKQVTIDNESYNIELLLNLGRSLLNNKFLSFTNLFIYQIDYEKHISSSMDDLLGYFICFVSFVYYLRTLSLNPNEHATQKKIQKHIQYLTNDKQNFDKNLFGKTQQERTNPSITTSLMFEKITKPHNQYVLENDKVNEKYVRHFFKKYMVLKTEDTNDLECNIHFLLDTLLNLLTIKSPTSRRLISHKGNSYEAIEIAEGVKNKLERKKQFTYKNMNQLQKISRTKKQRTLKKCDFSKIQKKRKLLPSYYLYAMIKYTQNYLKNDFYGSFSKEELIDIFS